MERSNPSRNPTRRVQRALTLRLLTGELLKMKVESIGEWGVGEKGVDRFGLLVPASDEGIGNCSPGREGECTRLLLLGRGPNRF